MKVFLASANAKKIREMERILAEHVPDIHVLGIGDVEGYGEPALARERDKPKSSVDHSRTGNRKTPSGPIPLTLLSAPPKKFCNESPV